MFSLATTKLGFIGRKPFLYAW